MRRSFLRPLIAAAVVGALMAGAAGAQPVEKQRVATISGKRLAGGLVTGIAWDGGTLIIQTAAVENGEPKAHYFAVAAPGMDVRPLDIVPASVETYWKRKAARRSPTGLGTITVASASKLPMYGISSQEKRFSDAVDMGGNQVSHEVRIGDLVLHRRPDTEPYDGEVWSWSPAELNRIAYVDDKGAVWVAGADGRSPERILKGSFTLPAWSDDGRVLAVAEKKGDGGAWEISVVYLPERFRRPL
jgi:hypothetical protein